MLAWSSIEQGLERFLDLVRADPRVRDELERSRVEFFSALSPSRGPMDQLRHLEWFLLERPSAALGSPPAHAWQDRWRAELPAAGSELVAALLHSIPGAFEVTSLVPAEGLWVRDLFTLGEHPVAEAGAARHLGVGDLLVGRLFPAGAGTFLLSPSVSVFRNPTLLAAVRKDLKGMRAARRGVLRIQQLELERIFHRGGAEPVGPPTAEEVRARVSAQLGRQGLSPRGVTGLLERVKDAARAGDGQVITSILNGLAFETGVDLSRARLALVELWDSERRLHGGTATLAPGSAPHEQDARAALAAFDRGRAEGKDLEQLFRELERDLGIDEDEEASSEERDGAPDFPGVIAAVVEEFLWESGREQGAERARRWGVLRTLGDYGRDIGVFEELDSARLLDFCTRWLLDESDLASVAEVETLMEALAAFCHWCEERHDLPLWREFGSTLDSLRTSVPRHMVLRQNATSGGTGSYRVVRVGERQALLSDGKGRERAVTLTAHQAAHLRDGDLVRVARTGGRPSLGATYPGELAPSFFRPG